MTQQARRGVDCPPGRPALAAKARLQRDRLTGRTLLLYPERGLLLNPSATEILRLCDGTQDIEAIVERLSRNRPADRAVIARDVADFLQRLTERGLLRWI